MEVIKYHPIATLASLAALVIVPLAVRDYFIYLSYGPGGPPYNVVGWLVANMLRPLSREQLSISPYHNTTLYLQDQPGHLPQSFPQRRGRSRPTIGPHPVPQRQLNQLPDAAIRQKLIARFHALGKVAQEKKLVEIKQSLLERHHSALFVSSSSQWHPVAQQTRGEIAHVHAEKDGSVHVVLSPEDCKMVIQKGWGQRHAFSGVEMLQKMAGFSLPVNYILVYAPRDEEEVEISMMIVKAAVRFMTGSQEDL